MSVTPQACPGWLGDAEGVRGGRGLTSFRAARPFPEKTLGLSLSCPSLSSFGDQSRLWGGGAFGGGQ